MDCGHSDGRVAGRLPVSAAAGQTDTAAGPAKEILGAVPAYEPLHPGANNDYVRNGQQYQIVRDPENFSQQGYAWIYGQAQNGNRTATGEIVNSAELTASHPTLPILAMRGSPIWRITA